MKPVRVRTVAVCVVAVLGIASAAATVALIGRGTGRHAGRDDGFGGAGGLAFQIAALAFLFVGLLLCLRRPGHPIAWIFTAIGLLLGLGDLTYQYGNETLHGTLGPTDGSRYAASLQNVLITPAFGLLALGVLVFPDGRLLSRRWGAAAGVAVIGALGTSLGYAFRPGPLDAPFAAVVNPLGIGPRVEPFAVLTNIGWLASSISAALAALSIGIRLHRAQGAERNQLKWVAAAGSLIGFGLLVNIAMFSLGGQGLSLARVLSLGLGFATLPVAASIAILRHRLFDIDMVINRTLVYSALTASLAVVYIGVVLLAQLVLSPVTEQSDPAIAISTLMAAAAVRPMRARIQDVVDRRFFRLRYDASVTLDTFSARLRDEVSLDALVTDIGRVVADTLQPAHVSVWLSGTGASRAESVVDSDPRRL